MMFDHIHKNWLTAVSFSEPCQQSREDFIETIWEWLQNAHKPVIAFLQIIISLKSDETSANFIISENSQTCKQ